MAPHHPIPNAKFPPITVFLQLAFSPPPFLARFSHKNFLQEFHATISCNNFPQHFPATISRNIFPQHFPELDTDWLAPHHPIPNAKFPPITVFLKLAFSPPPFPTRISRKIFLQEFPTRFSRKIFLQEFPARFSHKNFLQDFPATISRKIFLSWILIGWLPITLFQMLNFHQSLSFLNWLFPLLHFPQEFPTRISHKNFPQDFPATISHKNFPQHFPATLSCKIFPQDFPELDPDWLSPHHPIPNGKFPPITAFLKLAFSPPPFPTRISNKNFPQEFPRRIYRKIFPQEFPARFARAGS